ncbi:aminotransferase [Pseudalgibacter alginicilyticus]|uniref:Aminotransferase n=1 Tax=Pseudalgibacter alginicilyticus TaxID=1736674 RepID=A0A0P0CEW3_9FLAO|nr:DegT/DnrJ/EryC1/StrS family aminotransferase [Pseudalgibacter alginicilyticus]ALJ04669.1 aminotransferase [Pseudalgibacter alginicilyticus]
MIKFLDLYKINNRFQDEFRLKFKEFLESGHYILGHQVETFEQRFAHYCGTKYCIGTSNGLDALILVFSAYLELGVLKKGDEVLVPANTFIASVIAIEKSGLKPVLVEPDVNTYNISYLEIKKQATPNTKAILVVHLYGCIADMEPISAFAKKNDLIVIEDAAQAHGAVNTLDLKAGNLADAAAFSFYPSKNLGALGDAGAITTNNEDLKNVIIKLRNYGASKKYVFDLIGNNNRLDEIQAAFLNIKLNYLDADNDTRREIASYYLSNINNRRVKLPYYNYSKGHVFYAFVIQVDNREAFTNYLHENNVETLIHYPIAPHKQDAFKHLSIKSFPITEAMQHKIVSLPISPVMAQSDIEKVVRVVNQFK